METERYSWVVATLLVLSCGGKSSETTTSTAGSGSDPMAGSATSGGTAVAASGAGAGGSELMAMGGEISQAGSYITLGGGGKVDTGGTDSSAGAGTMSCDSASLLAAIREGSLGGLGTCAFAPPPGDGETLNVARGAVVIDSEGRVIDNTGLKSTAKQAWLDELMDQRWTCLAGQTLGYKCRAAG